MLFLILVSAFEYFELINWFSPWFNNDFNIRKQKKEAKNKSKTGMCDDFLSVCLFLLRVLF